jgi:4-hydroxymandelate oxidase
VGRPVLWGLGAAGQDGAAAVLRLLREEFEEVMVLSGRTRAADFGADAVRPRGRSAPPVPPVPPSATAIT